MRRAKCASVVTSGIRGGAVLRYVYVYACAIKGRRIRVYARMFVNTNAYRVKREQRKRDTTFRPRIVCTRKIMWHTSRWDSTDMGCHVRRAYGWFGLLKNS